MNSNSDEAAQLIRNAKKLIVFTGAGVSTNCGVPDFRGPNGLYETVGKRFNLPYPEAVFDIDYFRKDPKPFFKLSMELIGQNIKPSLFHKYIAQVESEGRLSLLMTQNIDMLHTIAGNKKQIECHGTYSYATCQRCGKHYELADYEPAMMAGEVPYCECGGVIKPDIVFFGENLPQAFFDAVQNPPEGDVLLVAGTSLTVNPAARFPLIYTHKIHSVLVNKQNTVYDEYFEYVLHEDIDEFTKKIMN